ncbi:invariant surface glycoprotein, putative [Trypanosoma equiperdum]|uniref:Invariant surface glycoprotein, putative n=1 Tax=Trypanosoma equiperdum TaxID=5694 RepID=A0A1G4I4X2_TRYEQ|nr:invariant surface glycoprotein, putative [Trypanosoma equiperdum]
MARVTFCLAVVLITSSASVFSHVGKARASETQTNEAEDKLSRAAADVLCAMTVLTKNIVNPLADRLVELAAEDTANITRDAELVNTYVDDIDGMLGKDSDDPDGTKKRIKELCDGAKTKVKDMPENARNREASIKEKAVKAKESGKKTLEGTEASEGGNPVVGLKEVMSSYCRGGRKCEEGVVSSTLDPPEGEISCTNVTLDEKEKWISTLMVEAGANWTTSKPKKVVNCSTAGEPPCTPLDQWGTHYNDTKSHVVRIVGELDESYKDMLICENQLLLVYKIHKGLQEQRNHSEIISEGERVGNRTLSEMNELADNYLSSSLEGVYKIHKGLQEEKNHSEIISEGERISNRTLDVLIEMSGGHRSSSLEDGVNNTDLQDLEEARTASTRRRRWIMLLLLCVLIPIAVVLIFALVFFLLWKRRKAAPKRSSGSGGGAYSVR